MAAKSGSMKNPRATNRSSSHRSATIQWIGIGIVALLAVLAAFVLFGEEGVGGGGHSGLPTDPPAAASATAAF